MSSSDPKYEIYTINLVKASAEACEIIAGYLGRWESADRLNILEKLPKKEQLQTLAEALGCRKDEVFEILAGELQETVRKRPLPPFTFEHLHNIAGVRCQNRMAPILECDRQDVLDHLFNRNAMFEVLFEFHSDFVRQQVRSMATGGLGASAVPHFVLLKFLESKERIERRYEIDEFGWEGFVDDRQIFSSYALGKLQAQAIEQGYDAELGSRLLVPALETAVAGAANRERRVEAVFLDALGIMEIKRRIDWIVRQLRESAQYDTNDNPLTRNALAGPERIGIYLDFYELGKPAAAWRGILKPGADLPSVEDRLTGLNVQTVGQSGTAVADAHLQVRAEEVLARPSPLQFWKKDRVIDNLLIVSCEIEEQPAPVDILIFSQVPAIRLPELTALFTSIRGDEVAAGRATDLGERILKKQLALPEDLRTGMINACNQYLVEIIRGLILTGVPIPIELDLVWKNRLNTLPPIMPIRYERKQPAVNREKILEKIQQQYTVNSNVEIVS